MYFEPQSFYTPLEELNDSSKVILGQCCNEASKIFVLRRFLTEDPSSSSSSAHFQKSKNLRSFEDFRPKIPKIFEKKSSFVEEILRENGRK